MAEHAPDLPEKSSPLLWFVGLVVIIGLLSAWFAHWYSIGTTHGHEDGPIELPSTDNGPVEPDHKKLIDDRGEAVLDQGKVIFDSQCARCHGPQGNSNVANMNPPPRNFWQDPFKNENGGGPYALFLVVTNGFNGGRMPPFSLLLKPEQRYAVIHYVRETFTKQHNAANYVPADPPAVVAKIPPPGKAGGGPTIKPSLRPVPTDVYTLLAATAAPTAADQAEVSAWLDRAATGATGEVATGVAKLRGMLDNSGGPFQLRDTSAVLVELRKAAQAGSRDRAVALVASSGAQRFSPYFALLSDDGFSQLFTQLQRAATSSAKGGK